MSEAGINLTISHINTLCMSGVDPNDVIVGCCHCIVSLVDTGSKNSGLDSMEMLEKTLQSMREHLLDVQTEVTAVQ